MNVPRKLGTIPTVMNHVEIFKPVETCRHEKLKASLKNVSSLTNDIPYEGLVTNEGLRHCSISEIVAQNPERDLKELLTLPEMCSETPVFTIGNQ